MLPNVMEVFFSRRQRFLLPPDKHSESAEAALDQTCTDQEQ